MQNNTSQPYSKPIWMLYCHLTILSLTYKWLWQIMAYISWAHVEHSIVTKLHILVHAHMCTVYSPCLSRAPSLKDLESLEPAFHSSLLWILENDPEPLDLTFTVEEEAFGQLSTHELKEGGMDIPVTNENKEVHTHVYLM